MRSAIAAILLAAFVVLGAGAALGEEARTFSGQITSLDRGAKALVVKGGEPLRKRKFFLSRGAQVLSAGAAASYRDLKRGDQVEIAFTESNSHSFAHSIAVVEAGGSAAASTGK